MPIFFSDELGSPTAKPNFHMLTVPLNPKTAAQRSRQMSMESLQTVGQPSVVCALKTAEIDPTVLVRNRGETHEEKQRRKLAVKQHRQERRKVRKTNQANFRVEHELHMRTQMKMMTMS